nr:putative P5a protein [Apple luteovirus 1]
MKFRSRLQRPPLLQSNPPLPKLWLLRNLNRNLLRNLNRNLLRDLYRKPRSLPSGNPLCRLKNHSGRSLSLIAYTLRKSRPLMTPRYVFLSRLVTQMAISSPVTLAG